MDKAVVTNIITNIPTNTTANDITGAHIQKVTHSYAIGFPNHEPRQDDPHYKDFNHIRDQWSKDPDKWVCSVGKHRNDFSECEGGMELHHSHIEFALMNEIDLVWLEVDYPGVNDPEELGAWVESAENLEVLCERHHRGLDGAHKLSYSDYNGIEYVKGMIVK